MSRRWLVPIALTACLGLACDPRGVSLGSEELCVADSALVTAELGSDEQVSTCARIGGNQLSNPDFELPIVTCQNGDFCQFPAADTEGWQTTSESQVIEIWHDGYRGVPASEGSQFVELDATSRDTLWQELALPPDQLMYWSFAHRGRNGVESVQLRIGPPDATVSQGVFPSPADAWSEYSGLYRVGPAEPVTRLELVSRSGLAEGNLVDNVVFAPVE